MLETAVYKSLLADLPAAPSKDPTDVYKLYDRAGTLLYVGISLSVAQRMGQHRNDKPWWRQVSRIDVQHCDSRAAALFHEFVTIQQLRPLYNVQGQADATPADWEFIVAAADRLRSIGDLEGMAWPTDEAAALAMEDDIERLHALLPRLMKAWERHKLELERG